MVGRRTRVGAWTLVGAWMLLIFLLSAQSADQSAALSGANLRVVAAVLDAAMQTLGAAALSGEAVGGLHTVIRKAAHFTAYLVLGVLTVRAVVVSRGDAGVTEPPQTRVRQWVRRPGLVAMLIATAYAATDEVHQVFVPGRSAEFTDVLLDSLGALVGIWLYLAWHRRQIDRQSG